MALNWQWSGKVGEAIYESGYTQHLYEGNAVLIALNEWAEGGTEKYSMGWFFVDLEHAKRMFGISKDSDGIRENIFYKPDEPRNNLVKFRFNPKKFSRSANFNKLIGMIVKAFPKITIEITDEVWAVE